MTIDIGNPFDLGVVCTVLTMLVGSHLWIYKTGQNKLNKGFKASSKEYRYSLVYAPLRKLLIDKHISIAQSIRYPYFFQRFKRAKLDMSRFRIKLALSKLFDKYGGHPSIGLDYGDSFPLNEIQTIAESNIQWADKKLLDLIQFANRSKYEQMHLSQFNDSVYSDEMMTVEELKLSDYIFEQFDKLNKNLIN